VWQQLNRLNVNFFTPSLIFSKVAFFLSPEILRELWIIPLFFVLLTLMSMTVSNILGRLLRLRTSQRSFAMAAAMFMNTNSLPIALIQSLVVTVPDLKWEKHDNKDAMLGRALNYLMLFNTFGMAVSTLLHEYSSILLKASYNS
jgi:predicted permease